MFKIGQLVKLNDFAINGRDDAEFLVLTEAKYQDLDNSDWYSADHVSIPVDAACLIVKIDSDAQSLVLLFGETLVRVLIDYVEPLQ